MGPRLDASRHQREVASRPGHRLGGQPAVGRVGPEQVEAEAVALRKVRSAPVEGYRGQFPVVEPERAGHRVVDVERAVRLRGTASLSRKARAVVRSESRTVAASPVRFR